jgi:flagellar hook assembly protein FlgD
VEVERYPGVVSVPGGAVAQRLGLQLSPNPSPGMVKFQFTLPRAGQISLEVFDVAGRRVFRCGRQNLSEGTHVLNWDGRLENGQPAAAGIYFARLSALNHMVVSKLVLVR